MTITDALASSFTTATRARGDEYAATGRVSVFDADPTTDASLGERAAGMRHQQREDLELLLS